MLEARRVFDADFRDGSEGLEGRACAEGENCQRCGHEEVVRGVNVCNRFRVYASARLQKGKEGALGHELVLLVLVCVWCHQAAAGEDLAVPDVLLSCSSVVLADA